MDIYFYHTTFLIIVTKSKYFYHAVFYIKILDKFIIKSSKDYNLNQING